MRDLLVDPKTTGAVLVSLPEELPVNETLELAAAVRDPLGLPPGKLFLTRFVERAFSEEEQAALVAAARTPLLEAVADAAAAHALRADRSAFYRERLGRELGWPLIPLPFLHQDEEFGRSSLRELAAAIGDAA
jgi:hypothetical protein